MQSRMRREALRTNTAMGSVSPANFGSLGPAPALVAAIVLATLVAGCARAPSAVSAPRAFLQLAVTPVDATIRLDDRVIGSARTLHGRWISVPPGAHRLAVSAFGHDRHEEGVELAAGKMVRTIVLPAAPER